MGADQETGRVVVVVLALSGYPPGDNLWEIHWGFYPKDFHIYGIYGYSGII
jgi:hypothetical protein